METKKSKSICYMVEYDKRIGGIGQIIVKASNEIHAITNAKYLCFTGSNFRNPIQVPEQMYLKPRQQGFQGSERA